MASSRMARVLGDIDSNNVAFLLCDMQERFRPHIQHFADILNVSKRLVTTSKILDIPLIVTEQYPKGLGKTVPELEISHAVATVEKTKFSMLVPEVEKKVRELMSKQVVLFGIEAHVCVQQTCIDLLKRDLDVFIIADACSSRNQMDRLFAFQRLREAGAVVTTSESIMFQLLRDKNHPKFKEVQALVKETAPTSGLVALPPLV